MSLSRVLDRISQSPEYARCLEALRPDRAPVWIEGLAGVSKTYLAAALAKDLRRVVLFVTATEDAAERIAGDLPAFGVAPHEVGLYPASDADLDEFLPQEKVLASSAAPERRALARTRMAVLEALSEGALRVVVAPVQAALRETIGPVGENRIVLKRSEQVDLTELARRLAEMGYERLPMVETAGQFAVRGGLLDVWPSTHAAPVRIELFDDEIESLKEFEPESQRTTQGLDQVRLLPAAENLAPATSVHATYTLLEHLAAGSVVVLDEPNHLRSQWMDAQERQRQRAEIARESEKVLPQHVRPSAGSIDLDELLRRAESFRLVLLTLLAHSLPWMRKLQDQCEKAHINSGVVDAVHGDIPELANRIRSWIGAGNEVVIASDQPHRVAELLAEQEVPATAEGGHARRPGEDAAAEDGMGVWEYGGVGVDGASEPSASPDALSPQSWGAGGATQRSSVHPPEGGLNVRHPHTPTPPHPHTVVTAVHGRLTSGFRLPGVKLIVLSDAEIFGDGAERRRPAASRHTRKFKEGRPIMSLLELKEGDLVVHVTHGIGRYRGLERRRVNNLEREFLRIDYQDPDRLFVPSEQLDRVQKYIGSDDQPPTIHRLGGAEWARTKSRVRAKVREMAKELIELYAARQAAPGHAYGEDTVWQEEMEAAFPYRETRDQLTAIWDTKKDMETRRPMDRLVCGDVGYGKTEVAIRAAFKAVTDGKQVAVLVPTTVLAQQHYNTFTERLAAFPVKVELLSRFRSRAEIKKALEGISDGLVDVVIGTHRLLSKDVQFQDLGLLIVDEEQRFGVAHKERLKQLKKSVDVLTLTATPIPRTLHMSLSGIRDMSVIEEPPEGRLAVRTYCLEADDDIVREAVLRELDRGGQVYYVHNRIDSIFREAERLQRLVPQARIRVGHGQMKESELEDVMLSFYEGEYDILVCTTIIESGLDIPNVNTILINDADRLGLSQLHQLRGRVGRSSRQAYCYLLYKPFKELSETAEKRLQAVREFTDLGAGFQIAMRDMEIRGAGNLLGGEQHGNMVSVGFDLYCQMIEEAVKELRGEVVEEVLLPGVVLPLSALIPEHYIPTEGLRIAFYKKIAACRTHEDLDRVQAELDDRFGDPPRPVWNMLAIMRLRVDCIPAGVARIETAADSVILWMARRLDKEEQKELYRHNRRAQFLPDRVVLYFGGESPERPVQEMVKQLKKRGGKAAAAAVQKQLVAANAAEAMAGAR
jgi:transcription-repair coupling factor (superfamily II helicase)